MSRSKHNRPKLTGPPEVKVDDPAANIPEQRAGDQNQADQAPGGGIESSPSREPMERPVKPPKRVRLGLKLKSADDVTGRNEVTIQWLDTLAAMIDADGKQEGFEYARLGQTISMDIKPGVVTAEVQGRRGRPYTVTFTFSTLNQAQWSGLIDALASVAAHMAKLLAGELPERFAAMLDSLGVARQHAGDDERDEGDGGENRTVLGLPRTTCSCGYNRPCKHAAAVGYLLAERLNDDPLMALTLRGMASEEVKEHLRQMRVMKTQGVASAHPDQFAGLAHEQPLPLEACVEEFWRYGPQLSELEHSPLPNHVPHALLRRLGPSPLQGRFPMVGLLASVYDTVTKAAIDLRDKAERSDGE